MKIIFLDMDGVLNSQELCYVNKEAGLNGFGGWFDECDSCEHCNVLWGQKLVDNLKLIADATDAKIVISSTWRKYFSIEKFKEMFAVYGWNNAPVIDKTDIFGTRGSEVEKWLDGKEVSDYVIIDDCIDFSGDQLNHFVNTDFKTGLSENDVKKAIEILNA